MTELRSMSDLEECKACQLAEWYPTFSQPLPGRKKGVTLKSLIVPVPPSFGRYLAEDGVCLPQGARLSSCLGVNNQEDASWSSDDDDEGETSHPRRHFSIDLEELTQRLDSAIESLGGTVLPKTNWSAPRDAAWINEGTLKCQTAGDVYLLLQSSDFVNSDVQLLQELSTTSENTGTSSLHIALRKWCQLHASHEFRCFVSSHRLVGLTQRHTDQYFEHLTQDREDIQFMIEEFFQEVIKNKYANGKIGRYVVDVYIDRQDRVWILDFNVWSNRTDSLLFSWDELEHWPEDKEMEFRIIETAKEILPQSLNNYRAPVDTVYLAGLTGGQPDKFQAFMDLCQRPEDSESEDEAKG